MVLMLLSPQMVPSLSHVMGQLLQSKTLVLEQIVTEFQMVEDDSFQYFCFSPDCRFVLATAGSTAYIWDIASSEP